MFDIVIQGRILNEEKLVDSCLCIEDERIIEIRRLPPSKSEIGELFNFGRKLLLPGAIDLHTHMREPGAEFKEDFGTGTASAAFGGVTAIVDMPNTKPPTSDVHTFNNKRSLALSKAHVDIGLNIILHEGSDIGAINPIFEDPAFAGFKVFMGETTGSLVMTDISALRGIIGKGLDDRFPVSVHAEDGQLMKALKVGRDGLLRSHLDSRPDLAESSAISSISGSMGDDDRRLHLLHVSSGKGLKIAEKTNATVEVTPHHLLLDIKNFGKHNDIDGYGKVNPPIRTPKDRAALWEGIRAGKVDTIGSDHAPHTIEEKENEIPPSGMPGVETMLPLLLQKVRERGLDLSRLISLVSASPARRLGLERRGSLYPGMIADVVVVDMNDSRTIRGEELHSRCGWTSFEGMKGIFPSTVFGRGELLIENGSLCSKGGRGSPIRE